MRWVIRKDGETSEVDVERVAVIKLDGAMASLRFVADGRSFAVSYERGSGREWRLAVGERDFDLETLTPVEAIEAIAAAEVGGPSRIDAPIPGKVVKVHVEAGDDVSPGQPLVVLEAMKMENELTADRPGRVSKVHVEPGRTVDAGQVLVELE
jgi:biotin carboxyl carrier protein